MTSENQILRIVGPATRFRLDVIDGEVGSEEGFEISGPIYTAIDTLEAEALIYLLV